MSLESVPTYGVKRLDMGDLSLTIARLADAAGVGVETVRYYERRGLVPQPTQKVGAYRRYNASHIARIRFIRRAQELGFSLQEIEGLLALQDGTDRRSIRRIATERLEQIRASLDDLKRMERTLAHVLQECESNERTPHCPIITAFAVEEGGRRPRTAKHGDSKR